MWDDNQRKILHLKIAGQEKRLDPLPMLRRYRVAVKKIGHEAFQQGLKLITGGGDDSDAAAGMILPIVKDTLQLPTFAEDPDKGYTEEELLTAFVQFLDFLWDSKKKDAIQQSSAGSAGDSAETQPTANTSGSSSAEMSSSPETPGPSPAA